MRKTVEDFVKFMHTCPSDTPESIEQFLHPNFVFHNMSNGAHSDREEFIKLWKVGHDKNVLSIELLDETWVFDSDLPYTFDYRHRSRQGRRGLGIGENGAGVYEIFCSAIIVAKDHKIIGFYTLNYYKILRPDIPLLPAENYLFGNQTSH